MTLLLLALACTDGTGDGDGTVPPHLPGYSDVNFAADGYIDLLDRNEILIQGQEQAEGGEMIDFDTATDFFLIDVDSEDLQALDDAIDRTEEDHTSVVTAMQILSEVDLELATRIGSHGATMGALANVSFNQIEDWHWSGQTAVTNDEGATVTGQFNVHWVESGWLVEMLQTSEDGNYNQDTWFEGYYHADGSLGWWDLYRTGGVYVVMEYMGDVGGGEAHLYWATTEQAGDTMVYSWTGAGTGTVDFADEQPPPSEALHKMVVVETDGSGNAETFDYDEILYYCWNTELDNVDCD